jgi:hypothetical protein
MPKHQKYSLDLDSIYVPTTDPEDQEKRVRYYSAVLGAVNVPQMQKSQLINEEDHKNLSSVIEMKRNGIDTVQLDIGLDSHFEFILFHELPSLVHQYIIAKLGRDIMNNFIETVPKDVSVVHPIETDWRKLTLSEKDSIRI